MRIKQLLATILIIAFFSFIWFMQNGKLLNNLTFDHLVLMNNPAFGYNSMLAFCIFYTIPFIVFYNLTSTHDRLVTLTRYKKRETLYIRTTGRIIMVSLVFSLVHTGVNVIFTVFYFSWDFLLQYNQFMLGSLFNFLGVTLFFTAIGLLYKLLYDAKNSISIATLTTYLIIGTIYFVSKLLLPVEIWTPDKDLRILSLLLVNKMSSADLLFTYIRQIAEIVILYLVGSAIYLRKDFI